MGKPTGFIEFNRELPTKRPVTQRKTDFKEFVERFDDQQLNNQSARCMNCGVPFCHNGCPLGNIIPEFNDAVYRKNWLDAYEILTSTNNFPEFTGRICPAPCESACVLGINQPPVAIEEIERHIIEIAFDKGYVKPHAPNLRSGKKIAIVGSGPAGMAAAAQLNKAGHSVTIFERDPQPGGLLRYGIPDFKLEKWVIDRRVAVMEEEGIVFKTNTNVGSDISFGDLLREYHAIVLSGGATVPRDLPVEGRSFNGVYFAMQFLKQQNMRVADPSTNLLAQKGYLGSQWQEEIYAKGKHVVVIGGGDTGSDCVGTSNRHGAVSVTQFELMPQPPQERTTTMPWPQYPMLLKTTSSHEEGCERQWAVGTKRFIGDATGKLTAIEIVDLEWQSAANGRPASFVEKPDSLRQLPCDLALLAMGFLHPLPEPFIVETGIELDSRGNVQAPETTYQTTIPKVFACGDMRRGQSLVVWAISEGRECARKVDEYLMGTSLLESKESSIHAHF